MTAASIHRPNDASRMIVGVAGPSDTVDIAHRLLREN